MTKKSTGAMLLAAFALLAFAYLTFKSKNDNPNVIVIASLVEIPPIVELRKGFEAEINSSEWAKRKGVSFAYENAQGDEKLIAQISDKLASSKAEMIYVLGTPLAQAIQQKAPDILLVQGAATDPVRAGLAASTRGSGRKYIASTDLPPIDAQIQLIREALPSATKIGFLYNQSEVNSVAVLDRLKTAAQKSDLPFQIIELPISTTNDVPGRLDAAMNRIDILYVPPDNTVHSVLEVVGQKMLDANKPWIACEESAIHQGALSVVSLSYRELGKEAADLALKVVADGANPAEIPIEPAKSTKLIVNQKAALALKIKRLPTGPGIELQ